MVLMMVLEIDKLTMHHVSSEVLVDVFIKWYLKLIYIDGAKLIDTN